MLVFNESATTFDKKRLFKSNLNSYLNKEYGNGGKLELEKELSKVESFLQINYGDPDDGDCTLVSILTCIKYYLQQEDKKEIYNKIRNIAIKYLFSNHRGTLMLFNKTIFKKALCEYGLNFSLKAKYIKNFGFNFYNIKTAIDCGKPVLLTMANDGRNYYTWHTVTIVGYSEYKISSNKTVILLKVYDN